LNHLHDTPRFVAMTHLSLLFLFLTSICVAGANWSQFRGEGGLGIGNGSPPVLFSADKNVKWQVEVPHGHSSPCLWGDKIALTGLAEGKLITLCLNKADGRELWRVAAPVAKVEEAHRIGSPAAPSCCTDGERLIAYFGSFGVLAYDWNGKELWQKPLPVPVVEFGTSSSPIIADGKVILVVDQDVGSYMMALDVKTGAEVWRVDRGEFRRGFATPFIWKHGGVEELIVSGSLWTRSYDLKDGKERWSVSGMSRVANTSPIATEEILILCGWNVGGDEDDRVEMEAHDTFLAAQDADKNGVLSEAEFPEGPLQDRFTIIDANKDGQVTKGEYDTMRSMFAKAENQLFAIKPGGRGDISRTHVVWSQMKHLPYVFTPVIANGRVFTVKGGGLASAYEVKSGSPIYQAERLEAASGEYYASAVTAEGRVYVVSQRGVVSVLGAADDKLTVLARNDLKAPVFASPAIVDGVIYLRTDKKLSAFGK
jgi:outer membrane protein assembly factor BamB